MANNSGDKTPLLSEFANDTDMLELVEMFVSEMPEKIEALNKCYNEQVFSEVQRLAHQLKGSSGGYGFPSLGEAAADLERTIKNEGTVTEINNALNKLVDLCNRASADPV